MDANSTWIEDPHTYIERYGVENKDIDHSTGCPAAAMNNFGLKTARYLLV